MMRLDTETRQLIVEAGLAAVNNGLFPQTEAIRIALPLLTENQQAGNIVNAVMLIGLCNAPEAKRVLRGDRSEEATLLSQLIQPATQIEPDWLSGR
ncbi:EscG/YscG/SsaH family type III secretion system needle protein co-chaperone [Serratia quinivorans]|uniref:EscG/YscG/SsaH family type III secretion system needle protein co-chaperone n=1 Tax=Serratia quinivorans TaxID=137545 RepID=UPI00217BCAFB|nr:EscG/YscG/SsaH family type III secretion system needle protein co-chaperone [Serratia quinivorans]CAI1197435.1 type III secretion system protein, SsaH family [Serratia quinivorans]